MAIWRLLDKLEINPSTEYCYVLHRDNWGMLSKLKNKEDTALDSAFLVCLRTKQRR